MGQFGVGQAMRRVEDALDTLVRRFPQILPNVVLREFQRVQPGQRHAIQEDLASSIAAYDPRGMQGNGVTYATSPMGADHTAGLVMNPGLPAEKWAAASQKAQIINAICDALKEHGVEHIDMPATPEKVWRALKG